MGRPGVASESLETLAIQCDGVCRSCECAQDVGVGFHTYWGAGVGGGSRSPEDGLGHQEDMTFMGCPSSEEMGWRGTGALAEVQAVTGPMNEGDSCPIPMSKWGACRGKSTVTPAHTHACTCTQRNTHTYRHMHIYTHISITAHYTRTPHSCTRSS